ncbi:ferric iron uptake transcriptional regulator [Coxiella endosymbiont of Rhipicephalus microplus]|uniref:ferric iron uptake transcriptional regulator n=1 Tax=Coxiella endosymbiont of Rhipicephalus microplus TaxID=1656186 RepID=UPI000C7FE8C0|nr:ferric iron uptake transcriptional regulator [Coxiella endosymbiont of Rhipicephalus microplus]PMB54917.1 Ferric uptake regulation protein FUR [Coxiella-like endosymbiont]
MENRELRKAGLKVTLPRLKILKILENADPHHMSAENVYRKLVDIGEDVGLATVYRVLTQFEAAGLVKRNNFEGGHSVFEMNQGRHHDHLVCINCGKVEEFIDKIIEIRQEVIAKKSKFKMTDHNLTIYGICQLCEENSFMDT